MTSTAPKPEKRKPKPKSQPAPSYSLKECFENGRKLYEAYGRGEFSKTELASTLDISATSGPTTQRIFSLKEFGILGGSGESLKVSDDFIEMKSEDPSSGDFKKKAYECINRSALFKELIEAFNSKLPPTAALITRLEGQKKFNQDRAKVIADVLEESLKFAGALDSNNNIVPPRGGAGLKKKVEEPHDDEEIEKEDESSRKSKQTLPPPGLDSLKIEVALQQDRKVVVYYPKDLNGTEAEKIGNVLKAITM
jgi:hypothetical protein